MAKALTHFIFHILVVTAKVTTNPVCPLQHCHPGSAVDCFCHKHVNFGHLSVSCTITEIGSRDYKDESLVGKWGEGGRSRKKERKKREVGGGNRKSDMEKEMKICLTVSGYVNCQIDLCWSVPRIMSWTNTHIHTHKHTSNLSLSGVPSIFFIEEPLRQFSSGLNYM